jgi:hypothetical protein
MHRIRLIYLLLLLIAASCSREEVQLDERALGLQYFPLETGLYRIYAVEEIQFFLNTGCVENAALTTYQVREAVVDSFANLEGGYSYRIARSVRNNPGEIWRQDSIWTARRDHRRAVLVENNIPVMKLSFPLEDKKVWDGNILNDREEDTYELTRFFKPFTADIGSITFPRTVTVVQEDFDDLIVFKDIRKEIYAEDIGLVYKERLVVEYDSENSACIGERIRNAGTEVRMYLIEYGRE